MSEFVLFTGVLVSAFSLFLFFRLAHMTGLVTRVFGSYWIYLAALLRLLLGAGLIASADTVAWPLAVEAVGWLAVLGGLLLVVIPRAVSQRMATALLKSLSPALARSMLALAAAFGGWLIWAALA